MMRIRLRSLNMPMFFCIFVFIFYTMFYQHVIGTINGLLIFLYVLMFFLCFASTINDMRKVKKIIWMISFIAVSYIPRCFFLFSGGEKLFNELIIRITCYVIVLYCIYCYVDNDRRKLSKIMLILWITAVMLAFSTFFWGNTTSTYYGGISIGELNKNMLSCYITIGFLTGLYFLFSVKSRWIRALIFITMFIEMLAQLNAASRTGVASILILVFAYIHTIYSIKYENKWMSRVAIILLSVSGLLGFFLDFSRLSDVFIVIERFQGYYTTGDNVRKHLQSVAWSTFLSSPIFGKGFGCVSIQCGTYSHSLYYEVLASIGIVGLAVLMIPILKYMIRYYKLSCIRSESMENRLLSRMMCWSVFLVLVTGISQIYIYYFFFYVCIALWISTYDILIRYSTYNCKF